MKITLLDGSEVDVVPVGQKPKPDPKAEMLGKYAVRVVQQLLREKNPSGTEFATEFARRISAFNAVQLKLAGFRYGDICHALGVNPNPAWLEPDEKDTEKE